MERGDDKRSENLSYRERLAIQGLMSGMTATDALLRAGYSDSVAKTRQRDVLGKPRVKVSIHDALETQGLSVNKLADVLREGLEATRTVFTPNGREEVPDYPTRHKFLCTALEVIGAFQQATSEQNPISYEERILMMRETSRKSYTM